MSLTCNIGKNLNYLYLSISSPREIIIEKTVLLKSFYLNDHKVGSDPQTFKFKPVFRHEPIPDKYFLLWE